ncbi:hypothetical protein Hypma_013250 [Hypsizygus marmoreus]|uniref:Uncharacterized protein n=1 Tax=Hypsizygus marmoreus TaxID=39966 RepID=A0A369JJL8_HYPMA|nr:hypothetical protein Hypma_013250 [Hypsizygus marmoreus]
MPRYRGLLELHYYWAAQDIDTTADLLPIAAGVETGLGLQPASSSAFDNSIVWTSHPIASLVFTCTSKAISGTDLPL